MSTTVERAADFLDTLGVNTRVEYTDGGYANISNVLADLNYLGINAVRDGISNGYAGSAPLSSYVALAQQGIKFTIVANAISTADLQSELALITQLDASAPGSVIAVEGPNEINNAPVTYNGVGGLQGALNLQSQLYALVHGSTGLQGVAVDYFTGYDAGSVSVGPNPATTAGLADFDTQHPYPNGGQAPYQWVNRTEALPNETPATGPAVYTETGYSTNGGTRGAVNADVQARYTLDLLMDDAQSGIAHTDLYQLMDAYKPGSPQGDDGYGLFDPNNQPKEAATAIHNLTAILADAGASAKSFATSSIDDAITGLPSTGHSMVIQKSDGASDIVVWNEPAIWDEATGTEIPASATSVTVALGATYQTVKIFDPLLSAAPTQTLSDVSSVTLGVTDHPLIVEAEPGTVGTPPPNPDTLTLRMSEDAWNGDAAFAVSVDGQQIGYARIASALHSTGDSSVLVLTGNWGTAINTVQIKFLNDAYGGSAAKDRNLYVDSIAYNGTTYAGTTAAMPRISTDTFTVGGSTPTAAGPADTVTLHLAEDAWSGNAQFGLTIDGKQISTPQPVTVLHSAATWQDFSFSGNFGAGTHVVGVAFVNAASGGSASTERNLYVNGIDLNGQHYGTGVTALDSNSTAGFSVVTTH